jgi:hypothetical protein
MMNGDDGVLALDAEVGVGPPDGIDLPGAPGPATARSVAQWFDRHRVTSPAAGTHR